MMRLLTICLATALSTQAFAADPPKPKTSYLTAEAAGPDFAVQGEYVGKIGDMPLGMQVIALGNGEFEAVVYPGGLPGAGWDGETKHKGTGKTEDGVTVFRSDEGELKIQDGTAVISTPDSKGELVKTERQSPTLGAKPPAGATVLFDGSNVDAWTNGRLSPEKLLMVGTRTKEKFGDFTLHLEFRTPFMPYARGQARGNSGMYLQDQYECQVLDSFGLEGADNECGGIYKNSKPKVNMCFPPLTWQTYDVEFTTAKLDDSGKIATPAKTTIRHNGVVIHENLEIRPTPGGGQNSGAPGALFLQDHGDPVFFQNIWIVKK